MHKDKIHRFDTKIRYNDLDMYSVTYHPNYLVLLDQARNQAFEDYGYPVEEQLKDGVGFTVGTIEKGVFSRPLFMGEEISVFTEVTGVSEKTCKLRQIICSEMDNKAAQEMGQLKDIIFGLEMVLVFVSIEAVDSLPLGMHNKSDIKSIKFTSKVREKLGF